MIMCALLSIFEVVILQDTYKQLVLIGFEVLNEHFNS